MPEDETHDGTNGIVDATQLTHSLAAMVVSSSISNKQSMKFSNSGLHSCFNTTFECIDGKNGGDRSSLLLSLEFSSRPPLLLLFWECDARLVARRSPIDVPINSSMSNRNVIAATTLQNKRRGSGSLLRRSVSLPSSSSFFFCFFVFFLLVFSLSCFSRSSSSTSSTSSMEDESNDANVPENVFESMEAMNNLDFSNDIRFGLLLASVVVVVSDGGACLVVILVVDVVGPKCEDDKEDDAILGEFPPEEDDDDDEVMTTVVDVEDSTSDNAGGGVVAAAPAPAPAPDDNTPVAIDLAPPSPRTPPNLLVPPPDVTADSDEEDVE